MTKSITTNLVGAHFRPPAKALLACLPAGHPLALRPEPQNEYDGNAVQVLLLTTSLQPLLTDQFLSDEMANQLAGQGYDLEQISAEPEWHLGYLPKAAKGNAALEEWNVGVQKAIHDVVYDERSVVACQLSFDAAGKPTVIIPWPPTASLPQAGELPATGIDPNGIEEDAILDGKMARMEADENRGNDD